ncbi:MAG: hypothetical protein IJY39_11385 [Clostridia bacterium]|nr:hypothetical protein [Clostridia bacterium]
MSAVKGFASLSQKRPPIQRAERWSPRARGEISYMRFSFCQAFSFAPLLPKEKADKRKKCFMG